MNKLLITFLSLLSFWSLSAQVIEGSIIDFSKTPVIGAHIIHSASGQHAHTDINGLFSIGDVKLGDTLYVSHIGYEETTVIISTLDEKLRIQLAESSILLDAIVIRPSNDALHLFTKTDLLTQPVNSSQELLRQVPGLFIGQHAGGGKAEQIFLRGFDIDHGTDINITVDNIPVNMVSHAHGQGYADLHFLIPETIQRIGFGKGAYYADQGNFATAGYVAFKTKDRLTENLLQLEAGQFNTQRLLGMFNLLNNDRNSAYVAAELLSSDGPFESSQYFQRTNVMGKYLFNINDTDRFSLSFSHFNSSWDASGQIPQRAVDDGSITRFGAIDDTEGGQTERTNVVLQIDKNLQKNTFLKSTIFYSQYDFELFSNFTFFLNDPVNGDQIRQYERRRLYGFQTKVFQDFQLGNFDGNWQAGINLRADQSRNNELSHTVNRQEVIEYIQLGDINETNASVFLSATLEWKNWVINPILRMDHFKFLYRDDLITPYQAAAEQKAIFSPKLNILYNQNNNLQFYLKTGKGFHSNDARVVVAQEGQTILPAAYTADLGTIWKPFPKMVINAALWQLFLEQEFVYVGDEGVVEPSGKTNRYGIDLSIRHQLRPWLFANLDANYTLAKSVDEPSDQNFIPLAPLFTSIGGLSVIHPSGVHGGVNVRYLHDRPANEDNSIVAKGYTVVDFNIGYRWKKVNLSISIQNLLDTEWNETQFATTSRLAHETSPVEEIHFTPGTPFFAKAKVAYSF